jgi:hypothetical protein
LRSIGTHGRNIPFEVEKEEKRREEKRRGDQPEEEDEAHVTGWLQQAGTR